MRKAFPTLIFLIAAVLLWITAERHILSYSLRVFTLMVLSVCIWLMLVHLINSLAHSFPKSVRKFIRWLHAMSFEVFIMFGAHLVLRPLAKIFSKSTRRGRSDGTPILLIHGYLFNWSGWIYLRNRLEKAGFGPIYTIDLSNVFGSINDYAKEVAEMVSTIKLETKKAEIILIGHSMGGLVACAYAGQLAPTGRVKAVITIGSPLEGTQAAKIGLIGQSVADMMPHSEVIRKVKQGMEHHPEIPLYQILTQTDELIIPATAAVFDSKQERHYGVGDIGHMALLFSSRIADKLIEWLKQL